MKNYRLIETNEVIPHNELRAFFPNVSFAPELDDDVLEALGLETLPDGPDPAPPVPVSVTRRQARQALLLAGRLDEVQPAIDAIPDPIERRMAQIEWDDAQEFDRHRPLVLSLAAALGLDDTALDALFVTAAGL